LSERDQKIARSHGAGYVLTISSEHGCNFALFNSATGARDASGGGVDAQGGQEYAFSRSMAGVIHHHLLGDINMAPSKARSDLLNSGLSDRERLSALAQLVQDRGNDLRNRESARNVFDKDVIAAITQLGTKSADAEGRSFVWSIVSESNDPAMIQPLLHVIANDPDKTVRFQAIRAVRKFLDAPGVREALKQAATTDPDSQSERFCCIETVREAAERASVPDSGFLAWVRSKLLDESLPGRSRLYNMMGMSSDGRFVGGFSKVGNDLAPVVLEIAERDPNPRVRAMAWDVMWSNRPEREFALKELVPVLLKDLQTSANERVRAGAARILYGYRDNAEVQEAVQRAQSDDSLMIRRAATGAGMPPVSAE
jgi:HEAT repeat protein